MSEESMRRRRRGAELENALLRAVWEELVRVGYEQLTYDAVAIRGGTSRPVLYRRWPTKQELVLAALRHQARPLPDEPPDTGELRGDVLALLHFVVQRTQELTPIREILAATPRNGPEPVTHLASPDRGLDWMRVILQRATRRGEIDPTASLPDRLATLPVALILQELLVAGSNPSDTDIREIVDLLFLPLVMLQQKQRPRIPNDWPGAVS
ncbi:TetR/AcrR family transcriptional regulator [Nocardia nova]|nr:TetR/AcrR family transcriptional regulator [Nocardia nova]